MDDLSKEDMLVLHLLESDRWTQMPEEDVFETPGHVSVSVRTVPDIRRYEFNVGWNLFPDCVHVFWLTEQGSISWRVSPMIERVFREAFCQRWPEKIPEQYNDKGYKSGPTGWKRLDKALALFAEPTSASDV